MGKKRAKAQSTYAAKPTPQFTYLVAAKTSPQLGKKRGKRRGK